MLAGMSSRELAEWMAYYELEPFGEWRADVRSAIVAMTVAAANRGKRGRAPKLEDFMPKFDGERQQDPESLLEKVRLLNAALGGTEK